MKRLGPGLPGHFYAMELLIWITWIAIGLMVTILLGIYLWGCGWTTPGQCARNNGFVPAIEISTTTENRK